jgi:hypothetical protein
MLGGINLAGHKIVKMKDLRVSPKSCGFLEVRTYVQSGNVVFETLKNRRTVCLIVVGGQFYRYASHPAVGAVTPLR